MSDNKSNIMMIHSSTFSTPRNQQQQQLQIKLGSLYHRIYQLHSEQYNIYPPFNNYEQYRIYCTQRLSRLRHCSYKIVTTKETSQESITDSTKKEVATTSTTVVKSLLLHNSKYANAIPPVQNIPVIDSTAVTALKQTPTNSSSNQVQGHKRSGGGGGSSKHAYHSRKVVYENIVHLNQPCDRITSSVDVEEEVQEKGSTTGGGGGGVGFHNNMDIYYHENVIWNLFYQAERAWAQACALLLVQQQPSSTTSYALSSATGQNHHQYKKKLSNHRHVQNRFNKAVHWSKLLYSTVRALLSSSSPSATENNDENGGGVLVVFVQECYAYMKWMEGNAAIEHKDYAFAYKSYSESKRTLYHMQQHQSIMNDSATSPLLNQPLDTQTYRETWKWQIENVLRPLVRYCQYEMKGMDMNHGDDEDDILLLIDQQQGSRTVASIGSTSSSTTKIRFRNVDVSFDHQLFSQQITVSYLKLEPLLLSQASSTNDIDDTIPASDADENTRLRLMSDLDDLMSFVMKEYKMKFNHQGGSVATSQPQQQQQLMFVTFYSYLKYYKLSIWRRQQELRIKETLRNNNSKIDDASTGIPQNSILPDMIHLYTTLQQVVLSMNELVPTTMTTTGVHIDEDDPYTLEAQAHIVRVRASRCYYMAQYYETIGLSYNDNINGEQPHQMMMSNNVRTLQQKQFVAARLLLQQSQLLTKRALEEMSACEDDATLLLSSQLINSYLTELEQLNINLKAMFCRLDATYYLHQQQFGSNTMNDTSSTTKSLSSMTPSFPLNPDRPLWMRYEEESAVEEGKYSDTTLADVPPLPIPLPCKGVFFDVAVQYIDEVIHDEVVRPLSDHSASLYDTSTNSSTTHESGSEAAITSNHRNFLSWFSTK